MEAEPDQTTVRRSADRLKALLEFATARHAADIHLREQMAPYVAAGDGLTAFPETAEGGEEGGGAEPLTEEEIRNMLWVLVRNAVQDRLSGGAISWAERMRSIRAGHAMDFACEGGALSDMLHRGRLRVQAFVTRTGLALTLRLLDERIPQLGDLGIRGEICEKLESMVALRSGLVLVTGPTGSGKSTTLAALLNRVRQQQARHIVTLEDPIEYRFAAEVEGRPSTSLVTQQEVGLHVPTYQEGLKAALRKAPNIIMLGEVRDRATMETALEAAQTGHLILTTLHTQGAARTLGRIIEWFDPAEHATVLARLAELLKGVLSQALLKPKTGDRKVLCCEFLAVEREDVRAAIRGYTKSPQQLNEVLGQNGQQTWDRCLEGLHQEGHIGDDTYRAARLTISRE